MGQRFRKNGDVISVVATPAIGAVKTNDIIRFGQLPGIPEAGGFFCVAQIDAEIGEVFDVKVQGIFAVETGGTVFADGDAVFYDLVTKQASADSGLAFMGYATEEATAADTEVEVVFMPEQQSIEGTFNGPLLTKFIHTESQLPPVDSGDGFRHWDTTFRYVIENDLNIAEQTVIDAGETLIIDGPGGIEVQVIHTGNDALIKLEVGASIFACSMAMGHSGASASSKVFDGVDNNILQLDNIIVTAFGEDRIAVLNNIDIFKFGGTLSAVVGTGIPRVNPAFEFTGTVGTVSTQNVLSGTGFSATLNDQYDFSGITPTAESSVEFNSWQIIISDAASSAVVVANENTIGSGRFSGCSVGAANIGSVITGLGASPEKSSNWQFFGNEGMPNTKAAGSIGLAGNPTPTAILSSGTWEKIAGTWFSGKNMSQWSQPANGVLQHDEPVKGVYALILDGSLAKVGGGSPDSYLVSVFENGSIIQEGGQDIVRNFLSSGGDPVSFTLVIPVDAPPVGQYEAHLMNEFNTNDALVSDATLTAI